MDGSIHPSKHLMYHYLKKVKFVPYVDLLEQPERIFRIYANNRESVYSFEEYEDNKGIIKARMKEIQEMYKDNKLIKKAVNANM